MTERIVSFGPVEDAARQQLDRCLDRGGEEARGHNHHNFAWWEEHDGAKWLVVRKGATPARPGRVNWPAWQARLRAQGVALRGGGADESPECCKRLSDVLAYHGQTIRVLHALRPIGVAMASRDTFDPYKD
jgi:RNA-splicing ligase RtcB